MTLPHTTEKSSSTFTPKPQKWAPPDLGGYTRRPVKLAAPLAKVKRLAERNREAMAARDEAVREAHRAGHSLREIAAVDGRTAMTIQRLINRSES